jgi:2'-5' RNA ligase
MAKSINLYGIFLTFNSGIEKIFNRLRENYEQYFNLPIAPHLTLMYPFVPVFSLYPVVEQLEKVARQTKPFNIVLNGIKYFEKENNVIYAAVENKRAVKNLHMDIAVALEGVVQEWRAEGKYSLDRFIPHVTIGNKIPNVIFPELKKMLSKYRLHFEDSITDFSLYTEIDGIWQPKRVFELAG